MKPSKEQIDVFCDNAHHHGRQPCVALGCSRKSIAGMRRGYGACRYHWIAMCFGEKWANRCVGIETEEVVS